MDLNFLNILDSNIAAIKRADNNKSVNEKILATAKLILSQLDYSDNTLSDYEKLEKIKLLADFGEIAQSACNFYQTSKEYLDPIALNEEIGQALEAKIKKLTSIIAMTEKIDQDSAELLKIEKELDKKADLFNKKQEKITSLKNKKEKYTDEAIKALETEEKYLYVTLKTNKQKRDELEKKINEYKETLSSLSNAIVRIDSEKYIIEENIIDKINEQYKKILEIFVAQSKDLDKIVEEIKDYKRQYAALDDRLQEAQKEHNTWTLHYGEDKKIVSKLREYGISSIDNFIRDIEHLDNTVGGELKKFDSIIKDVIVEQEKARAEISSLQNR